MITIGIDPGSLITGYGIVATDGKKMSATAFGVVRTDAKSAMPVRLKKIYDALAALIDVHRPKRLSLETAFYGKNVQSALKLGQVRGAVMLLGINAGLEVAEYAPREVKKAVTGNGAAAKEQVEFMVKRVLELETVGAFYDASDALAIALCDVQRASSPLPAKSKDWKSFIAQNPHLVIR